MLALILDTWSEIQMEISIIHGFRVISGAIKRRVQVIALTCDVRVVLGLRSPIPVRSSACPENYIHFHLLFYLSCEAFLCLWGVLARFAIPVFAFTKTIYASDGALI